MISILLTLASALPVRAAAVPAMHGNVRWNPQAVLAPPVRLPGEMIRGSQQRYGSGRLVVVARNDTRSRPPAAPPLADGSARTGRTGPRPTPVAHRARPGNPVTVDGRERDDGARRRLPSSWASLSPAQRGRLVATHTREVVRAGSASVCDSVFHEAHAPPLSSSFVASRS